MKIDHCTWTNSKSKSTMSDQEAGPKILFFVSIKGTARTLVPTNKNCALEPPLFGVVVRVSPLGVQWMGLAVETQPSWSLWSPCQVSMLIGVHVQTRSNSCINWSIPYLACNNLIHSSWRRTFSWMSLDGAIFTFWHISVERSVSNLSSALTFHR